MTDAPEHGLIGLGGGWKRGVKMTPIAFSLGSPGIGEILIILLVALIIFGNRLPDVGRSLGRGLVEFKKGLRGVQEDVEKEIDKKDERGPDHAGGGTGEDEETH